MNLSSEVSSPRQLLVINPNTSEAISQLMHACVQRAAGSSVQVRTVTARFGPAYIASQAGYAVATHAALDAWAADLTQAQQGLHPTPDAVMIGCFGDPGLHALRDISSVPVTGLAEAAMVEASRLGRFGIVTGGTRWKPMIQQLASAMGITALADIDTVSLTGAQLAADPQAAQAVLAQACQAMAERLNVQAIILGGAGLAGLAALIQQQVSVRLIDSVEAGTRYALSHDLAKLLALAQTCSEPQPDTPWSGLSTELTQALQSL